MFKEVNNFGLNMFFGPLTLSEFWNYCISILWTNLVIHLSTYVNLIILIKFCYIYLIFQPCFIIVF